MTPRRQDDDPDSVIDDAEPRGDQDDSMDDIESVLGNGGPADEEMHAVNTKQDVGVPWESPLMSRQAKRQRGPRNPRVPQSR